MSIREIYIQCYCVAIYIVNEKFSLLRMLSHISSRYKDYLIRKGYATVTKNGDIDISKALDLSFPVYAGMVEYSFMTAGGLFFPLCVMLFNKCFYFLPRWTSLSAVILPFVISFAICKCWINQNEEWKLEYKRIKALDSILRKKIVLKCLLIMFFFATLIFLNILLIFFPKFNS